MSTCAQLLGWHRLSVAPSLQIFSDGVRTLFNAGENVQRYHLEHKLHLSRTTDIFLTTVSTWTVGGLPGLLLSLEGAGVKNIRIWGPAPLKEFVDGAVVYFAGLRGLNIEFKIPGSLDSAQSTTRDSKNASHSTQCAAASVAQSSAVSAAKSNSSSFSSVLSCLAASAPKAARETSEKAAAPIARATTDRGDSTDLEGLGNESSSQSGPCAPVEGSFACVITAEKVSSSFHKNPYSPSTFFSEIPQKRTSPTRANAVSSQKMLRGTVGAGLTVEAILLPHKPPAFVIAAGSESDISTEQQQKSLSSTGTAEITSDSSMADCCHCLRKKNQQKAAIHGNPLFEGAADTEHVLSAESETVANEVSPCDSVYVKKKMKIDKDRDDALECGLPPDSCFCEGGTGGDCVVYVIRTQDVLGKFHPEKAKKLGVPVGPLFGQLKSGKSITLSDGKLIKSEEVCDSPDPGQMTLVLQCLNEHQALHARQELSRLELDKLFFVFHMTAWNVVQMPEYQKLLQALTGPQTQHVLCDRSHTAIDVSPFGHGAKLIAFLHSLMPPLMPRPSHPVNIPTTRTLLKDATSATSKSVFSIFPSLTKFNLTSLSKRGIDESEILTVFHPSYSNKRLERATSFPVVYKEFRSVMARFFSEQDVLYLSNKVEQNKHFTKKSIMDADVNSHTANNLSEANNSNTTYMNWTETEQTLCRKCNKANNENLDFLEENAKHTKEGTGESKHALLRNEMKHNEEKTEKADVKCKDAEERDVLGIKNQGASGMPKFWKDEEDLNTFSKVGLLPCLDILGTGAAAPSQFRNVSGLLLRINPNFSIIMDFGEGSLSQILNMCHSWQEFCDTLASIKMIFVSHLHADHHLGICPFLYLRKKLFPNAAPPLLIAPARLQGWLRVYSSYIADIPHTFRPAHHFCVAKTSPSSNTTFSAADFSFSKEGALDGLIVQTTPVEHIPDSYGIRLDFKLEGTEEESCSVVYSGDTRPCKSLFNLAENATILIHEATFEDSLLDEAIRKRHSSLTEVLVGAAKTRCKNVVLTHFSQRYPTTPVYKIDVEELDTCYEEVRSEEKEPAAAGCSTKKLCDHTKALNDAERCSMSILFAFDCMRLPIKHLEKLAPCFKMLPGVINDLFAAT